MPRLLKDGAARGDVNVEVSLRLLSYVHYGYLSLDQPHQCIRECQEAVSRWSRRGYHLQNYGATFMVAESYLYLGDYEEARSLLAADWERMSRSFILRWQTLQIMVFFLKGRAALACWLDRPQDQALRAEIQQCARRLTRIRSHWTAPMAAVLDAGIAAGEQRFDEASRRLEEAAEGFQNASLLAYAAAARHFSGVLSSGDRARILMKSAADFLQSQHVVQPPAFLRMLLPGRWTPEA